MLELKLLPYQKAIFLFLRLFGGVRVVTGTNPQGERVLILWRNTKEMNNENLNVWFERQGDNTKDQESEIIYVNNNLERLRRVDQTWSVRLIEDEFQRRMFEMVRSQPLCNNAPSPRGDFQTVSCKRLHRRVFFHTALRQ